MHDINEPLKNPTKEGLFQKHCEHSHETMASFDDVVGRKLDLIEVCGSLG